MARSHHRKKHKSHVQQFKKERSQSTNVIRRRSSFPVFMIVGGLLGLIIGYIATDGSLPGISIGLIVGGIAGFLLGRKVDASAKKE